MILDKHMTSYLRRKLFKTAQTLGFAPLEAELRAVKEILVNSLLMTKAGHPRYSSPRSLSQHEFQVFSQNGEDGVINEIFKRIGVTDRFFVEIGVEDGIENNSAHLLLQGWRGIWIDCNKDYCQTIRANFDSLLSTGQLRLAESSLSRENAGRTLSSLDVPREFDLLCVDIDGNDYWIWKALENYQPRVVVIEYNACLGPVAEWIMPYDDQHSWQRKSTGNYFGASLKSLEILGRSLNYSLVGCNLTGTNAFFVRSDFVSDRIFHAPFCSEHHFEKPLYPLEIQQGHKRNPKVLSSAVKKQN